MRTELVPKSPSDRLTGNPPVGLRAAATAAFLLAALAVGSGTQGQPAGTHGDALRVGLLHPEPWFCQATGERSQKDVRVLRLAFGIGMTPAGRLAAPWFYTRVPPEGEPRRLLLRPEIAGAGGSAPPAKPIATPPPAPFAAWQAEVARRLPGFAAWGDSPAVGLAVRDWPGDPFAWSRLQGAALLPWREEAARGAPDRAGPPPAATLRCPAWPQGVRFREHPDARAYTLDRAAGHGLGALTLTGFRSRDALAREIEAGRLDAVLLEPEEVASWKRLLARADWAWGRQPGTQQVALRIAPALAAELGAVGRRALSMALNRTELGEALEPGRFTPARAFFEPLLPPQGPPEAPLRWDARSARALWLGFAAPTRRLRLATLPHPRLREAARIAASQWQRTLNATVLVQVVAAPRFAEVLARGEADLALDVLDLDNGSLQALWAPLLPGRGAAVRLAAWEAAFRERAPYLPLLANDQYTLARAPEGAARLALVCPGCTGVALAAVQEEPEPERREAP